MLSITSSNHIAATTSTGKQQTSTTRHLLKTGIGWLACLTLFFVITYSTTNWLAAQKMLAGHALPVVRFSWEAHIPFWAWTIVPYCSINLMFALALLRCSSLMQLHALGRRLLLTIGVGTLIFALFPLANASVKPSTVGLFGLMFDAVGSFDEPFNQSPSLHIALLVVLWSHLLHHASQMMASPQQKLAMRWGLHLWAGLIAVSVLTTYQHHVMDIPGGLALGLVCLWLVPDPRKTSIHPLLALQHWFNIALGIMALLTMRPVRLAMGRRLVRRSRRTVGLAGQAA